MTLETLQQCHATLTEQYRKLVTTQVEDSKLTILHANAMELRGALQLIAQLIQQEQATLAAPPGATGPGIP